MRKIVPSLSVLAGISVLLGGCDRAARDANATAAHGEAAGNRIASAADRFADATDRWGDNASARIDAAGEGVSGHIANANDRLAALVDPSKTDGWVGRWRGVEGLMLVIARDPAKGAGHYILTNQYTLDDKGVFHGVADGAAIRFERPDGAQRLTATDGKATGLKYLAGKTDCLTVKPGEGYCRD